MILPKIFFPTGSLSVRQPAADIRHRKISPKRQILLLHAPQSTNKKRMPEAGNATARARAQINRGHRPLPSTQQNRSIETILPE